MASNSVKSEDNSSDSDVEVDSGQVVANSPEPQPKTLNRHQRRRLERKAEMRKRAKERKKGAKNGDIPPKPVVVKSEPKDSTKEGTKEAEPSPKIIKAMEKKERRRQKKLKERTKKEEERAAFPKPDSKQTQNKRRRMKLEQEKESAKAGSTNCPRYIYDLEKKARIAEERAVKAMTSGDEKAKFFAPKKIARAIRLREYAQQIRNGNYSGEPLVVPDETAMEKLLVLMGKSNTEDNPLSTD